MSICREFFPRRHFAVSQVLYKPMVHVYQCLGFIRGETHTREKIPGTVPPACTWTHNWLHVAHRWERNNNSAQKKCFSQKAHTERTTLGKHLDINIVLRERLFY